MLTMTMLIRWYLHGHYISSLIIVYLRLVHLVLDVNQSIVQI